MLVSQSITVFLMTGFSTNHTLLEAQKAVDAGQMKEAFVLYAQLAEQDLGGVQALLGAGVTGLEVGAFEPAIEFLTKAHKAQPSHEAVVQVLAEALRRMGGEHRAADNIPAARQCLEQAFQLCPDDPVILNDMAVILRAGGELAGAEALYRNAIAQNPGLALLHANLGNLLEVKGQFAEAEQQLKIAYSLEPEVGDVASNLAALLTKQHRPKEALPLLEQKARNAPHRWDVLTNLGVARLNNGDVAGAERDLRRSLELNPKDPEARYNLAWVLLLTGRYEEGWSAYEWRWRMENFSSDIRNFDAPLWDGQSLGGTLLLHAEQGIGDAIQFMRLASRCTSFAQRVVLELPKPLLRLAEGFDPEVDVIGRGEEVPSLKAHAPLMSLPHLLELTLDNIPAANGYLIAPSSVPNRLQLPKTSKRKIGLVWAGSPVNKMDAIRSIPTGHLNAIVQRTDVFAVNLQVGPLSKAWAGLLGEGDGFDAGEVVTDFADTAAVLTQLDLVIAVDTAVVHLAGALGVPCWVMVPFMPDYRWMLDRSDTPWYDSVKVFRQPTAGDWSSVIANLNAELDLL